MQDILCKWLLLGKILCVSHFTHGCAHTGQVNAAFQACYYILKQRLFKNANIIKKQHKHNTQTVPYTPFSCFDFKGPVKATLPLWLVLFTPVSFYKSPLTLLLTATTSS